MATPTPRAIVSKVRTFVRRYDVLRPGPLVLAVSGGTDSTALALILRELADELRLVLHVAHFDHGMRSADAAADAQFVADLANRIGAPLRLGKAEGPLRSEDDARRARYAFLRRAAAYVSAQAIATGHTLDDQAETLLLHLVRGSGIAGAAGMRPLRDGIARPLLVLSRGETAALCRAAGITPREDPSNASLAFARNRVRLRVLPELEAINPKVREALARFAVAAADADAALERAAHPTGAPAETPASGAMPRSTPARDDGGSVVLDVASLPVARALRERALAGAYRRVTGVTLTERHRSALVGLAATAQGTKRVDLPGAVALREYGRLRFIAGSDGGPTARERDERPLTRGGTMEWPGWRIALDVPSDAFAFAGAVDAASARRLRVRGRRAGDRVSEHGKLQDLFVDAKVPARMRDGWPLITLDGAVLWVPGVSEPPRTGRIAVAAGPVGDHQTHLAALLRHSGRIRQVASKVEARRRGGK